MTKDEIAYGMKFIKWLKTQNSAPSVIGLSGGEPTLNPYLWTDVVPSLEEIKMLFTGVNVEIHTNGSRPVPEAMQKKYHKFFWNAIIGHDMFHRQFRKINQLFLNDYSEIASSVILRSNKAMLRGYGAEFPIVVVNMKGRGADILKNDKYQEVYVKGFPHTLCQWHQSGEITVVNFLPGLIGHCGEKSHPLPDGSDKDNFSYYNDSFETVLKNALQYQLTQCNTNCSQKCISTCIALKKDVPCIPA